jgi:hypothetical protein
LIVLSAAAILWLTFRFQVVEPNEQNVVTTH